MLFDNILATTHFVGTAAFMIYVTDAFGYLGSIMIMFYKKIFICAGVYVNQKSLKFKSKKISN